MNARGYASKKGFLDSANNDMEKVVRLRNAFYLAKKDRTADIIKKELQGITFLSKFFLNFAI